MGLCLEGKAIVLGDRAAWIDSFAETYCPNRVRIVDWYHAMEHIWALGKEALGEGAEAWVKKVEERLWRGDVRGAFGYPVGVARGDRPDGRLFSGAGGTDEVSRISGGGLSDRERGGGECL